MICIIGPILAGLTVAAPTIAPQIVGAGVAAGAQSSTAPKGPASRALQSLVDAGIALTERGVTPVLSRDPFTGNTVLSSMDQSPILQQLLFEKAVREATRATPEEIGEIRELREQIIEARSVAADPAPVGQPVTVAQALLSTAPTAREAAPGVVSRGNRPAITPRLSTACAGRQTGFSRLRCGRGRA